MIILHPFIPFITEEIWLNNKLDKQSNDYLMFAICGTVLLVDIYFATKAFSLINSVNASICLATCVVWGYLFDIFIFNK